jgi:hypothetical protein
MESLSFKENVEYEIILSQLTPNNSREKWIDAYPFTTLVEKLIDNYSQVKGCMRRMEGSLNKTGDFPLAR